MISAVAHPGMTGGSAGTNKHQWPATNTTDSRKGLIYDLWMKVVYVCICVCVCVCVCADGCVQCGVLGFYVQACMCVWWWGGRLVCLTHIVTFPPPTNPPAGYHLTTTLLREWESTHHNCTNITLNWRLRDTPGDTHTMIGQAVHPPSSPCGLPID